MTNDAATFLLLLILLAGFGLLSVYFAIKALIRERKRGAWEAEPIDEDTSYRPENEWPMR